MNMTTAIAGLTAAVVLLAQSAINFVENAVTTKPVSMTVQHLRFVDGEFDQWLSVEGGPVQADWAAKIIRDGRFLCTGGGRSIYNGDRSPRMTPSFWTGGDCPEDLVPPFDAEASWEYKGQDGTIHRVSAKISPR